MSAGNFIQHCIKNSFLLFTNRNFYDITIPISYSVRWKRAPKRKPIWLPTAPSKLFRIPKRPDISPQELEQIVQLYVHYRSHMKSVRNFLLEEYRKTTDVGLEALERAKREELEHEKLMEENRIENERIAKIRSNRLAREHQEEIERVLKLEMEVEMQKQRMKQKAEELVLKEKESSVNFITKETLEKAIEEALDNPVNYNFAIDLNGNKYWETEPPVS